MKFLSKTLILSIALFGSLATVQEVSAQGNGNSKSITPFWFKNGWFINAQSGVRLGGAVSSADNLEPGLSVNAGLGYLFTPKIAVKGRVDYNTYNFNNEEFTSLNNTYPTAGNSLSFSLENVFTALVIDGSRDLSRIKKNQLYRLELHGGIGWTTYSNSAMKDNFLDRGYNFDSDPLIKGNDDMGHIIAGMTHVYDFNGKFGITLDISTFILFAQDYSFDSYNFTKHDGIGNITTASLGFVYRFL